MALFTSLGVAAFLGVGASFFTGAIAFGLNAVVGIGISLAARAISGGTKKPQAAQADRFSVQGKLQAAGDVPRSFNLGYSATAGSLVYANTWGEPNQTPNAYLTQVIALADLPGGQLVEFWVNGELCTLGPVQNALLGAPALQYRQADGTDRLWVRYHDGSQTTADELCVTRASSTERPYESTRVGTGVAYVVITAFVDDKAFTGFPTFKFAVSGIPLYDVSKDSTAGGSGSHRWADRSTWGGDGDNLPAVQIYNVLRGVSFGGTWLYGLQNIAGARLPAANWIAQIAKCRDAIQGENGLEPTYRAGGQINVDAQIANTIEALLTACQGRLSEIGGFYKVHLGPPDSPTFGFTDADILSTEEQTYRPFFALADSINGIAAKYPLPAEAWNTKVAPPLLRTDLEEKDGDRRLLANPSFDFVPYSAQVQRLMSSALEEAQRARTHTLTLPPEYWIVEPGDVGTWSSARNGYIDKMFRADGVVDRANLDVGVSLTEVDPSDYDWDHDADFENVTSGPTVLPRPDAQGIRDWYAEGTTIDDPNGIARRPAIRLEWDGNVPAVVGIEYEIRLTSDHSRVTEGASPPGTLEVGAIIVSQSILPKVNYQARGRYIPTAPRDMLWSAWLDVLTPDVNITLADFDAGLRDLVTRQITEANARVAQVEDLVASLMVDQDAHNRIERFKNRELLEYREADLSASIETVSTIASSTESAFASYQITVNAQLGALSATTTTTASSLASLNSAYSSYVITTNASLNGLSSSITTTQTAVAGINGQLAASYGVSLDVNGYMSGFKLLNGGGTSAFIIRADLFQIAVPGTSSGTPQTVFQLAFVNGIAKIAFRGDMLADGTITARNIVAGQVTAVHMAANSITAANGAIENLAVQSFKIGDNAVTVPGVALDGGVYGGPSSGSGNYCFLQMYVDTTGLAGKPMTAIVQGIYNSVPTNGITNCSLYVGNQSTGQTFELSTRNNNQNGSWSMPMMGAYTFTGNGGIVSLLFYFGIGWNNASFGNMVITASIGKR